jgi:hypothetical protein
VFPGVAAISLQAIVNLFQIGTFSPPVEVQQVCNTRFEFVLRRRARLDKTTKSNDAAIRITEAGQIRFRQKI